MADARPDHRLIYAASERCADLLYLAGFMAPDPFLWLEAGGATYVVVSALEIGRARHDCRPGIDVLSLTEARRRFGLAEDDAKLRTPEIVAAIAARCDIRTFAVPNDFPLGLARQLEGQGLQLSPCEALVPERACKTAAEVAHIRAGVRLAEAGLAEALAMLRQADIGEDRRLFWQGEPLTAERLRGAIDAEIARRGGTASRTIVAPGCQGADPHQAGSGPLRAGEPIVLDIFPRVDATGYHGDLTRTVVKGAAPDIVRRAFAAVQAAQTAARAAIRAGVPAAEPHRLAAQMLLDHGFATDAKAAVPYGFFHGLGHGLGLDVHESPRLSDRVEEPLAAGHVVTVEPGLYYPEWGGIRLEDVVVVTETGCDNLTEAEIFLEL